MSEYTWKVLIIDDEEGIRRVMSIALRDAGYQVLTAPEGRTGLELCRQESPQIVITDIRMPGMDGIEVLKRIREEDPDKEVIVVTAFGEMELAVRALQLRASDFVIKPVDDGALQGALERAKDRYTRRKEWKDYAVLIEERWMDTAEQLARTFDFQNNLIESSIDGIMACDKEGKVITFNRAIERILGYSKNEVVGKMSFDQFFPPGGAEKVREELCSEAYGGKNRLFLFESNMVTRTGNKVPVQVSATILFEGEEEIGVVGFFRDLREVRKLEQQFADQAQLLHQDKMISLGRLSASVVHEINNPLAGILNYIRLMIKIVDRGTLEAETIRKFQRYLTLIESETGRCSKIVSNLLTFARKSEMEFAKIDMGELIQRCIMLSQHKLALQNISLVTNLDSQIPEVWGDFNEVQQCLINLIFNAIDAMPGGGSLTLSSSFDPRKDMVKIRVEDTGCGIPKEDLPLIFDPFFSTKGEGKGLGLGLSTVQGIIDRHKGTIEVHSEPGKGTTFILGIPAGKRGPA